MLLTDIRILFAVLAVISFGTAIAVFIAVAPITPLPRQRSTMATLMRAITARDFLIPVVLHGP